MDRRASLRRLGDNAQWLEARFQSVRVSDDWTARVYDNGGAGTPLVFVPVVPMFETAHVHNLQRFGTNRRVVTYRRVDPPDRPVSVEDRARELSRLLDALGISEAHFCGLNEGALAAMAMAFREPQRVKSISATCLGVENPIPVWMRRLARILQFPIPGPLVGEVVRWLLLGAAPDGYIVANLWGRNPDASASLRNGVVPLYDGYLLPDRRLTMPVLNIHSSPVVREYSSRRWVDLLPNGRLAVIPGDTHLCMWSKAAEFELILEEFIQDTEKEIPVRQKTDS